MDDGRMTLKVGQVWRYPETDTWRVIVKLTPKRFTAFYFYDGYSGAALAGLTYSEPVQYFCEHLMELVE